MLDFNTHSLQLKPLRLGFGKGRFFFFFFICSSLLLAHALKLGDGTVVFLGGEFTMLTRARLEFGTCSL